MSLSSLAGVVTWGPAGAAGTSHGGAEHTPGPWPQRRGRSAWGSRSTAHAGVCVGVIQKTRDSVVLKRLLQGDASKPPAPQIKAMCLCEEEAAISRSAGRSRRRPKRSNHRKHEEGTVHD